MFKNYITTAFRNLLKQKLHSVINITGLSVGMTISILILSYVWFELSFDRFHSKFDQIYRVVQSRRLSDKDSHWGKVGNGMAAVLKDEFPEIQQVARLNFIRWKAELSSDDNKFIEDPGGLLVADSTIFDVFDIILTSGDPATALQDPNSIILTEEESIKYFGKENPIGKIISIREAEEEEEEIWNLKVTGIAKAMPANSHFQFKFLIPYEREYDDNAYLYVYYAGCTYIILPEDYPPEQLEKKFPEVVNEYIAPQVEEWAGTNYDEWLVSGGYWKLGLQPLKDVHLDNHYTHEALQIIIKGNQFYVRIYTIIAFFIIALACINFIILSAARSGARAKEVGVRKVIGVTRVELIRQFLTESTLVSVIALVFAIIMVVVFSRPFNRLLDIQTAKNTAGIVFIVSAMSVVTIVVGLVAGSYPAFFLSAFRPVNVLKGQLLDKMKGKGIRNGLVVFQFVISMVLIISSVTVYKQFFYMQHKDLGFDKENIIIIKNLIRNLWREDGETMSREEKEIRHSTLRQEVLNHPSVISASLMSSMPGTWGDGYGLMSVRPEGEPAGTKFPMFTANIDHAYLDVFGLEMIAGENFKSDLTIPVTREGFIINETAANLMDLVDPVGKRLLTEEWKSKINDQGEREWEEIEVQTPIIGVFKDFHNRNLRSEIRPTLYFPLYRDWYATNSMAIRFEPGNIRDNIAYLEKTWNKLPTDKPLEYVFFDTVFEDLYRKEQKLAHIFTFFTVLAIFIACLGIYGLSALTAEQRTKEIGIRRVMGASVRNIIEILSKIYLKLLIIATLIACPLGYIIMDKWLQGFAFHINIGTGIFVFTILITIIIVLSSVSYHSVKAALTNPANTLKYE